MSTDGRNEELWDRVSARMKAWASNEAIFKYGQQDSLGWISDRIKENGVIIADEVGLGKTRLALLVMTAVLEEGGDVIAVVPPGLLFQWSQEANDLSIVLQREYGESVRRWSPVIVRSYSDLFKVLAAGASYPLANQRDRRWILLSQSFDIYAIKKNALAWRLELPALVRAHKAMSANVSRNDRWIQYWKRRGFDETTYENDSWGFNENKAAQYLSGLFFESEIGQIFEDDRLRPNLDGDVYTRDVSAEFFQNGQPGRKLLMHLVGNLIGAIDLLVIDEAHKSREEEKVPQTRLGRILEEILKPKQNSRRISLTATPIELSPEQWVSLLARTGIREDHPRWERLNQAINRFSSALNLAHSRPSHTSVLDELIRAAQIFEAELRPLVTRRRRLHQAEMMKLLPDGLSGAHPHRNLSSHSIEIETLSDDWRRMVLALEGQGLASKGLSDFGHAQRQADIRYSSGLLCEFEVKIPEDRKLTRKEKRTFAWARIQERLAKGLTGSGRQWLWSHPRVLRAADRIEHLCELDGLNPREKVLVFGRFTEPMRALRDILNTRHILRSLDLGSVALLPNIDKAIQRELIAVTFLEESKKGKFKGNLEGKEFDSEQLLNLVEQARGRYEKAREFLRKKFNGERIEWITQQPGGSALVRLKEEEEESFYQIFEMIRAETFDVMLYSGLDPRTRTQDEIDKIASMIWIDHLNSILHGDDELSDKEIEVTFEKPKDSPSFSENKKLKDLDLRADSISPQRFVEYLKLETRSEFCRVLDGGVSPMARRSVQASFNRRETGPYVLIAQSLVGREGLNLHKACKKVFLFHPEWNPGVMEQQIGRVDRIESQWEMAAQEWNRNQMTSEGQGFPKIEIDLLVFRGTYDEYQSVILTERRASMNAQLFGALLDEAAIESVPAEYRAKLAVAAPSFAPPPFSAKKR